VLPVDYVNPVCSGRTSLCDEVLNDVMVSVPGSIKEPCGNSRRRQYEEVLFRCEDQRFEV